jgi:hypothetical protein
MSPADRTMSYYLGLDLGQMSEFTALAVVGRSIDEARKEPAQYACRYLHRWPLGTSYPTIVDDMVKLVGVPAETHPPSSLQRAMLVIDGTGVGRAVVEMFEKAKIVQGGVRPIAITSGLGANLDADSWGWNVAKKELVGVMQVLLQTRRLKIASTLPMANTLTNELLNFKVKVTTIGSETFESWRERDHDDLVLALACALWYAETYPPRIFEAPTFVPNPPRKTLWDRVNDSRARERGLFGLGRL